jgi:hypothetical protein
VDLKYFQHNCGSNCLKKNTSPELNMNKLQGAFEPILRARDHITSSTLIGGKGGVGPSSLYTKLEGAME